jgi:membrane protease YdiL (CAAX protease family)
MKTNILKAFLLFITATVFIQIFYAIMTNLNLYDEGRYFPFGYIVHISYYVALFLVTFLFVGKLDFSAIGLKRTSMWKRFLLTGLSFGLIFHAMKTIFIPGTFSLSYSNRSYSLPLEMFVPAYIFLGLLIGLAEESAFRGFVLNNFLKSYKPLVAILLSSLLFGIYHVNFADMNFSWWTYYVGQAFTGGLVMSILYYKTGRNLLAPITYHSTNIIVGQLIPWTPLVSGQYLLGVQPVINVILSVILVLLPMRMLNKENIPHFKEKATMVKQKNNLPLIL